MWIPFLALAMRTEPSRWPQCSRTGTVSRGVHDRAAGCLSVVLQLCRWTRRTVWKIAPTRRQLDQKARKTSPEPWWTTDASTRESSNHAVSSTSWCSLAARPGRRVSHTTLTGADWCSDRAVARCEMGLFPVIQTVTTVFRVFWHKLEIRTPCSETSLRAEKSVVTTFSKRKGTGKEGREFLLELESI